MVRLAVLLVFACISFAAAALNTTKDSKPDLQKCGQAHPFGVKKRVVGGTTSLPGAWPWQALLLFRHHKRYNFVCSGALIHPYWVLTAAHCIHYKKFPGSYKIRLGEFDRSRFENREQSREVEKIIVHPYHDIPTRRNNDLALIKLKTPATLNRWVNTVCLPTAKDYLHGKLTCYASGWGQTRKNIRYSDKLQQAHIPLVTKYNCRRRANQRQRYLFFPGQTVITHQMLCGGDDSTGASTCLGDSGGPYVCANPAGQWVLQGITSWGSSKCLVRERYSVFTKVRVFTSWIEKMMNSTAEPAVERETSDSEKRRWIHFLKRFFNILNPRGRDN